MYYHVTTFENAALIQLTGKLVGSKFEGGYVFAWRRYPNKFAINGSGARSNAVVISFKTYAAFKKDTGVTNPKAVPYEPVVSVNRGPVHVYDVQIVG